jgi:hypothetical protein
MPKSAKPKKSVNSVYRRVRHPFLCEVTNGSGEKRLVKIFARVRHAKKPVELTLDAGHVRESIKQGGVGDTGKCSMAICLYTHRDVFPHKVEGHVDWLYSRAFVVSRVDKYSLPTECYLYEHDSDIAYEQDLEGGQQRILAKLEETGPVIVRLRPPRDHSSSPDLRKRPGNHLSTGLRDPLRNPAKLKGVNLRYAISIALGAKPKPDRFVPNPTPMKMKRPDETDNP